MTELGVKNYPVALTLPQKLFSVQSNDWMDYSVFFNDHAEVVDEVLFIVNGHTIETLYNGSTRLTI